MTLLLTNEDIAPLLDPSDMVKTLDSAYRAFSSGSGVTAPRLDFLAPPDERDHSYQLGVATGIASSRYAAIRIKSDMVYRRMVAGTPRKEKYAGKPGTYLGLILLFDTENGALLAILHDGLIQKLRVGADSALGVRYMARSDANVLAILGSGGMAETHLACIRTVRELREVRIFSPTKANREAFAQTVLTSGLNAKAVESIEAAVEGADLVSACTNAIGSVIAEDHLNAGQHVTAIGGGLDKGASARVDVALRFGNATAPAELAGLSYEEECLTYAPAGAKAAAGGTRRFADIPAERRIFFSELLADSSKGRIHADQITFSERGNIHGLQFAAAAGRIYERAIERGAGCDIPSDRFYETVRN